MANRIVIIEDNQMVSEAFALLLTLRENFEVINTYTNCESAIKNIKQDAPDIILMDIDLPGMSGIEGTKKIKKILPKTDILIITVF